jgi:hypothetical protein
MCFPSYAFSLLRADGAQIAKFKSHDLLHGHSVNFYNMHSKPLDLQDYCTNNAVIDMYLCTC